MMMEAPELKESIAEAVHEFASKKQEEGVKSLSRMTPEKVGLILYLFCLGVSQSQMVKKYGFCHKTIKHTLMEYADHLGKWTEVGARLSKQLFLNLHSLEEDIIEEVRERMESGKLKAASAMSITSLRQKRNLGNKLTALMSVGRKQRSLGMLLAKKTMKRS